MKSNLHNNRGVINCIKQFITPLVFYLTVTLTVVFLVPHLIVILAVPFFLALIFPLLFTVATLLLEEEYVTFSKDVIGVLVTVSL